MESFEDILPADELMGVLARDVDVRLLNVSASLVVGMLAVWSGVLVAKAI